MLTDNEIIAIRQFCLNSAIAILKSDSETFTNAIHIETAEEIEDYLLGLVDTSKAQLGKD